MPDEFSDEQHIAEGLQCPCDPSLEINSDGTLVIIHHSKNPKPVA